MSQHDASPLLARWQELEIPYAQHNYDGEREGPMTTHLPGELPILITAVHATNHFRASGSSKLADTWTGGMVSLLAEETGATAILRRRTGTFAEDDQVLAAVEKQMMLARPRFVLDIHASAQACAWDLVFGTGSRTITESQRKALFAVDASLFRILKWAGPIDENQLPLLNQLRHESTQQGLSHETNIINYAAISRSSVVTRAMQFGIPAIQVESRPSVRVVPSHAEGAMKTFNMLKATIQNLGRMH